MNTYEEIYHHGIKGQKWGVRRFQKPDGTLTRAGKKRYATLQKGLAGMRKSSEEAKDYAQMYENAYQNVVDRYNGKNGWKNALEDEFGTDGPDDDELFSYAYSSYGVKNSVDLGKAIAKERIAEMEELQEMNDFLAKDYRKDAAELDALISRYENMPVSNLTKEDLKYLKKQGKNA